MKTMMILAVLALAGSAQAIDIRLAGEVVYECRKAVERLAPVDYRWIGRRGTHFPHMVKTGDGKIIAAGDAVEMQNHFGNWVRAKYACIYDVGTGRAEASAEPGRL